MIHFEEVLPTAFRVIKNHRSHGLVEEVLVLRDLRGRVRLFLKPREGSTDEIARSIPDLANKLETSLAPFWGGIVDIDSPKSDFFTILEQVRSDRHPIEPQSVFPCWSIVERCAAKSAWMGREHKPPWPLNAHTPAIIAFYSHKGGVGRTTCLCAAALNLARSARKVAVVDLDLEAPGLGTLLADNPVEHGVADYLLERLVAGPSFNPGIKDYVVRQTDKDLIGNAGEPIVCVPVGLVDEHYMEKLSRIDYELVASMGSPGQSPLADLLLQLKREFDPEYVFLDCRAGLHDLGGLAVHCLSHATVLLGLDSHQSWQGVRCLVRSLGLIDGSPPPLLMVQAMDSPLSDERAKDARSRFLQHSYDAFSEHFYSEGDVPDIAGEDEPHFPLRIPYSPALMGYQRLSDVVELITKSPYVEFVARVEEMASRGRNDDAAEDHR